MRDISQEENVEKDGFSALLAMVLGNFVGLQGPILVPLWLGIASASFELGESTGGWLVTTELGAMAIASLFISTRMDKLNRRTVAWLGIILAVAGNLMAIYAFQNVSFSALFAARGIAGLGEGLIVASVNAAAAGTHNPTRTFALMSGAFIAIAALVFASAPFVVEMFGGAGVFGLMGAIGLVTALAIVALPSKIKNIGTSESRLTTPFNRRAILMLLGFAIANACFISVWTFVGQIGIQSFGLHLETVGSVLGLATLLGILGPLGANFMGLKLGKSPPVCVALGLYWLALLAFSFSNDSIVYISAVCGASIVVMFFITFMMTRFGELDVNGRVAAAAPAFQSLGNAIGPALGGSVIVLMTGWSGLALIGTLLLIVAGFLIITQFRTHKQELEVDRV